MAMTFLQKVKQVDHTKSVKFLLHQHLNGPEKGRPLTNIHASELTKPEGFCPRAYALSDVTKQKPANRWLTTSENITFHLGRVMQDSVVEWMAEMGKTIGHWRCIACSYLHQFQSRPFKCDQCQHKVFKPEEVRFVSAVTGASCGVDMLVALGEPKLVPIELKTMAADQFKTLLAPLAEHKLRTNLYLRIIAESDHPWASMVSTERARVLYISKSGYGCADDELKKWGLKESFSPFKEFEIARDDSQTEEPARRSKVVKDFRDGKVGMPKGVCPSALAGRAKGCAFKGACFSGDHPGVHEWKGSV